MANSRSSAPFQVPDSLLWLNKKEAGASWLEALPDIFEAACQTFDLTCIGRPYSGGCVSYVVPARRNDEAVVLKLQFQHRESECEADALKHWDGNGAVRLLDHAPDIGALLLETCDPGRFLADDPEPDKIGVMADLLRRLLVPAGKPFRTLAGEADLWLEALEGDWESAGKPCDYYLVDVARAALKDLTADDNGEVLLHQDLHGHNVLSSSREAWLAIDPKPLVGDPAFALSPIVRSFEFGHSKEAAMYRLDRLSEELELDRERARLWTIGQAMAWAFDSSYSERHFEMVRWLMAD